MAIGKYHTCSRVSPPDNADGCGGCASFLSLSVLSRVESQRAQVVELRGQGGRRYKKVEAPLFVHSPLSSLMFPVIVDRSWTR